MDNQIREILIWGTKKLNNYKINSAYLDAELLLSFVLKKSKEFLYTYPDFKLNKYQIKNYKKLIQKRSKNYPIAYILGYKEFFGIKFIVNEDVLIPRPETELLVEEVLKIYNVGRCQRPTLLEIGTGSGCISIALSKNGVKNITATDISEKALKITKKNSKLNNIKNIKFVKSDLLKNLKDTKSDIIIANLPYLENNYKEKSIKYEPSLALYSKDNGLYHYKKLFKEIKELEYKPKYIFIELNPEQFKPLTSFIKNLFPKSKIENKKDLTGILRIIIVEL
ncbi:MAG: peptide chain release factor N(5)-glutamine methyltransferase [Patescibacteria group bacterium]|nr:peptide chain release factor N(5)-glutamine methyltransferase [Patescibacteria group bacterium]MDD4304464.1 peptide chain release factor N(5)-glutamine methyltransferase [Patescibacteria group bacterium]MDD4694824.1 peptide chain release factor N(5)-glutamine methyltransferase [Patescibacteria group bacterium]